MPADIFLFIGALGVSISLHQCSLTIQDDALPHSDSTPSLAFGLVTDAERSFDIVPVSQSFGGYRSYLFNPFTYQCLHMVCSLIQYFTIEYLNFKQ